METECIRTLSRSFVPESGKEWIGRLEEREWFILFDWFGF